MSHRARLFKALYIVTSEHRIVLLNIGRKTEALGRLHGPKYEKNAFDDFSYKYFYYFYSDYIWYFFDVNQQITWEKVHQFHENIPCLFSIHYKYLNQKKLKILCFISK